MTRLFREDGLIADDLLDSELLFQLNYIKRETKEESSPNNSGTERIVSLNTLKFLNRKCKLTFSDPIFDTSPDFFERMKNDIFGSQKVQLKVSGGKKLPLEILELTFSENTCGRFNFQVSTGTDRKLVADTVSRMKIMFS